MTGGGRGPLSLLIGVVLVIALTIGAFLVGGAIARRTMILPVAPTAPSTISSTEPSADVSWIRSADTVEGELEEGETDEWRFAGRAGQEATLQMWFHPGAGSDVSAEVGLELFGPHGERLGSERGSAVETPYLHLDSLPEAGRYRVRVSPVSGAPGRYSLGLDIKEPAVGGGEDGAFPTAEPVGTATPLPQTAFQWPIQRREISGWTYHDPDNPSHIGLDIDAEMWDSIVSVADGTVVFAGWGGGYGYLVVVDHGDGWQSYYGHLSEIAVDVEQVVEQGELLGGAGSTGKSTGPHLHFELRYEGRPVDPHVYLPAD